MSPTSILIIAHAPLAHALRECALHVFADCGSSVAALDVQPNQPPEESLAQARIMLDQLGTDTTLVLTDVFGANPAITAGAIVSGAFFGDKMSPIAFLIINKQYLNIILPEL